MGSGKQQIWRVIDLINWGESYFKSKSITNARREIEWLLCHILNCRRIDLYLEFEKPLDKSELGGFRECVLRRIHGEPFQHIIGKAPFYGRDFMVNDDVLIPRPETELIIDIMKDRDPVDSVWDVGTGSGCLAITVIREKLAQSVLATDISESALTLAKDNSRRLKGEAIRFLKHDFLSESCPASFDVVISNPPYVAKKELPALDPTVVNYDPEIALTDGRDGLTFYRKFAETGKDILNQNGFMLLEFGGRTQADKVEAIFNSYNYKVKFHNDLQGDPRVVEVFF